MKPMLCDETEDQNPGASFAAIKQESDVRAAAARLPGGFVDADDILDLRRMGGM